MSKRNGERRYDCYGEFRLMAEAEGYVLVRRKGAMAAMMTRKDWDNLAKTEAEVKHLIEGRRKVCEEADL